MLVRKPFFVSCIINLLFCLSLSCQEARESVSFECILDKSLTFAILQDESNLYCYKAFNLEFSPIHMQARWVGYFVSRERLETKSLKRQGIGFEKDEKIRGGSANNDDYRRSGYDRGHLTPARDMAFSKETFLESFLFSNISPQTPSFNRGKWAELEKFVRKLAKKYEMLYVVTGPILPNYEYDENSECKTIGENKVFVPFYFFKALLFYSKEKVEAIAFIMPNKKLKENLSFFACSVDYMEEIVGIDVFASLPDEIEERVEKEYDEEFWFCND